MRSLGVRARTVLSLLLGMLAGGALITIPSLVAPTNQATIADTEDRTIAAMALADFGPEQSTGQDSTSNTSASLSIAFGLFLILFPASILSVLARRWTTRKLADYWYE